MNRTATDARRPFQVYLDEKEMAGLVRAAQVTGRTKSDLAREAVRRVAIQYIPVEEDPLWQLVGLLGHDTNSPGDLSVNHDKYLVEWERERYRTFAEKPQTRAETAEAAEAAEAKS